MSQLGGNHRDTGSPRTAALARGALWLMSQLPLRALHALGAGAGWLAAVLPNPSRHTTRVNIELCFPNRPVAARRALARCALREAGKGALELGWVWCRPLDDVLARVRRVDNAAIFHDAVAAGDGLIVLAPHLGCWEVLQAWIAQHTPSNALYRPPRQPALEGVLNQARARTGVRFWPTTGAGVRALYRALRAGEAVGVLPDQQPPEAGVYAPFFGQPAKTMTLFGKLAARSGAPVLTGWAERLPRGYGYVIHWQRADPGISESDPQHAARAVNRSVEQVVRVCPCQYQWAYRRFSRQPKPIRSPYRRFRSAGRWLTEVEAAHKSRGR